MKVKIDTKEKFHVITINEPVLAANMTENLSQELNAFLNKDIKNIIVNLQNVEKIDEQAAMQLVSVQQAFFDANNSLVFCNLKPTVEKFLYDNKMLEVLNITPTESEAWDIVQLEEIEREFL